MRQKFFFICSYKLEDEVFGFKEKLRELQTQNKWRDSRTKAEAASARRSFVDVPLDAEGYARELRDVLERENDLREQLGFTEDDLQRTRSRLQVLSGGDSSNCLQPPSFLGTGN